MKKVSVSLGILMAFTACKNTWDSEARDLFYQACIESAEENHMKPEAAESMCQCRLEKVMEKYPSFNEALGHTNEIMSDPEIKACR